MTLALGEELKQMRCICQPVLHVYGFACEFLAADKCQMEANGSLDGL